MNPSKIFEAACVFWFLVQKMSFTAIGIPQSLPLLLDLIILSQFSACFSAKSDVVRQNAFNFLLLLILLK